ncbi:UDP-forming cellulose synthase catalytic subunit [Lichenihabitans sp. Uapishka_5]|uniref:UDP-forming cellulose synthase catalytic subunit n=1 Tax=Lichenihabitans sp. Uapishka_5 TaxID=3037302 RepID=UPI003FA593DB
MKPISIAGWGLAALLALLYAELPLSVEAQLAIVVSALGLMVVVKALRLGGAWRSVFLALGTFIVLRYIIWRVTSTVPSISSPLDFAAGAMLVLAECYCVTMMFLSLFTIADPIDRPRAPLLSDDEAPTVDIFVPSYNESLDIVAPTLAAAKRITYPAGKLNVFLLDDGGTDAKVNSDDPATAARALKRRQTMQALCRELDVQYLAREENQHAKAGNLNNGLAHSTGDLVVVFDADHVPAQNFLRETVGHFRDDKKLFLVQTPHFFLNPDPIERNLRASQMPTENEMFYGLVQKGLDKWNAAFFCGSAAVLRREALEQVGGFHGSSITEDAESALELHSRGWNSLYVETPMVAGLQAEKFDAFITQRSRWCRGMVQILLLKTPLFKSGLSVPQRLSYLASSMFWLFPLSRMAFIFAPMLYIFFDLKIYVANQQEFFAYTVAYMASALLIQSYIFGRVRWPWISDVYEYIQSVMLFRAVISVFINPRNPKFEVTAKGQTLEHDRISEIALPYFVVFFMVLASLVVLGYRFAYEPEARELIGVVGVWSLLNLILAGLGLGAVCELRERRSVPRVDSRGAATLVFGTEAIPVTIEDMSFGGLQVRLPDGAQIKPRASGTLRMADPADPSRIWETPVVGVSRRTLSEGRGVGLRFFGVNGDRFRIIAATAFADVGIVYRKRQGQVTRTGILHGSALMTLWCIVQTGRGLYYAAFRRDGASPSAAAPSSESSVA